MQPRIFQLNISPGGVPKMPLREAEVRDLGLVNDEHRSETHGGPERALVLFSLERILELQDEGHPIYPGSTGENVTIAGMDWNQWLPGVQLALGDDVRIEITGYASPCYKIGDSFVNGDFARISQKVHPGYSRVCARVLHGGRLVAGQAVQVLPDSSPQ